ncbi:hypothetical protein [Nonomuraea angiospora]
MPETITADTVASVLRATADRVATLPYARVVRDDVHRALKQSAEYGIAQAALVALTRRVGTVPGLELLTTLLTRYSTPLGRDEVAAGLRAAAEAEQVRPRIGCLVCGREVQRRKNGTPATHYPPPGRRDLACGDGRGRHCRGSHPAPATFDGDAVH